MRNEKSVIERYLKQDEEGLERVARELKYLVRLINSSGGEYSLQLRDNYFNIYYQGNSLAKVIRNNNDTYSVLIHQEFVKDGLCEKLEEFSSNKPTVSRESGSKYINFKIKPQSMLQFFQRNNLNNLSGKIRQVHNGEEITMEQVMITDNPPSPTFIIIDRQVADYIHWARIDLLAVKRDSLQDRFHFIVIEVKLGRNPELREKVGEQVNGYVDHIREYILDYAKCYQENYRQKKNLGLFSSDMPGAIVINTDPETVEGIVVSCGYSQLAEANIEALKKTIGKNRWNIKVVQMPKLKLN